MRRTRGTIWTMMIRMRIWSFERLGAGMVECRGGGLRRLSVRWSLGWCADGEERIASELESCSFAMLAVPELRNSLAFECAL